MAARRKAERAIKRLLVANTLEDLFKGGVEERRITFQVLADLAGCGERYGRVAERVAGRAGVSYRYLRDRALVFTASISEIRSHDFFRRLGVPPSATLEEIRKRWREVVKETHPDASGGDSELFREARAAYEALTDPARRALYDGYWAKRIAPVEEAIVLASAPSPTSRWSRILLETRTRLVRCQSALARALGRAGKSGGRAVGETVLAARKLLGRALAAVGRAGAWVVREPLLLGRRIVQVFSTRVLDAGRAIGRWCRGVAGQAGPLGSMAYGRFARGARAWVFGLRSALLAGIASGKAALRVAAGRARGVWLAARGFSAQELLGRAAGGARRAGAALSAFRQRQIAALVVFTVGFVLATMVARNLPLGRFEQGELGLDPVGKEGRPLPSSTDETLAELWLGEKSWGDSSRWIGTGSSEGERSETRKRVERAQEAAFGTEEGAAGEAPGKGRSGRAKRGAEGAQGRASAKRQDAREPAAAKDSAALQARAPRRDLSASAVLRAQAPAAGGVAAPPPTKASELSVARTQGTTDLTQPKGRDRKQAEPKSLSKRARAPLAGPPGRGTVDRAKASQSDSEPSAQGSQGQIEAKQADAQPHGISHKVAPPKEVTAEEAVSFIELFRKRYEELDASRLGALFAEDASENGVVGRGRIASAYEKAFGTLDRARYSLGRPDVRPLGPWADVTAPFTIAYRDADGRYGEVAGRARWWLVRDGHALKVLRLEYEIDRRVQ